MEGSSWDATVVDDIVFLGGENSSYNEHMRDQFSTRFMFGCQKKETGIYIFNRFHGHIPYQKPDTNRCVCVFVRQVSSSVRSQTASWGSRTMVRA